MEHRKILPMNLFAGQRSIHRHRKQAYEHGGRWRVESEMYVRMGDGSEVQEGEDICMWLIHADV